MKVVRNGVEMEVLKKDMFPSEVRAYDREAKRKQREREAGEKNIESERARIAKEFNLDPKEDADEIEWRVSEASKEQQQLSESERQKQNLEALSLEDRAALNVRVAETDFINDVFRRVSDLVEGKTKTSHVMPDRAVLLAQEHDRKHPVTQPSEGNPFGLHYWKTYGVLADNTGQEARFLDCLTVWWINNRFRTDFAFDWTLADRLMERVPTPTDLNPWYKPLDVRLAEIRGVDIGSLFPRPRTGMKYVWTGSHYEEQNIKPADPIKRDATGNELAARTDQQIESERHQAARQKEVQTVVTEDSVARMVREHAERLSGVPASWQV
jgi:hypothetical protein